MSSIAEEIKNHKLYHYTSLGTLKGIVENKEIWLNNILYSNDSLELKYFYNVFKEYINSKNINNKLYFRLCLEINKVLKEIDENPLFYVMCFTKKADDSLQWYQYSVKGSGINLEFDIDKLVNMHFSNELGMKECIYEKGKIYNELDEVFNDYDIQEFFELPDEKRFNLLKALGMIGIKCKHPSFSTEDEIRIYAKQEVNNNVKTDIWSDNIKQRYILKLVSNKVIEDIIVSITLGPKSNINSNLLKRYLKERGLNRLAKNIRVSESSLC